MKLMILGSGRMGYAIAYDLLNHQKVDKIILGDMKLERCIEVKNRLGDNRIETVEIDVTNIDKTASLMKDVDCIISSVVYKYNHFVAQAAVQANVHYCDLGQNVEIVDEVFELDKKAIEKKLTIIPDGGLAPGMVNIVASHGIAHFDEVENVFLRVGGIPQFPNNPPLNYNITWSVQGLINEYIELARVIKDKKEIEIESMTELEEIIFPHPFDKMEAFVTSGGTSTLPSSYENKIKNLDYKTIRYPGHCQIMNALIKLGFTDEDRVLVDGKEVVPRHLFESLLRAKFTQRIEDVVLLRVTIEGRKNGKHVQEVYELIDYYDKKHDMTALMRTTGFSLAIVAGMIARGEIKKYGVLTQEESIPTEKYIDELIKRGFQLTYKENILD